LSNVLRLEKERKPVDQRGVLFSVLLVAITNREALLKMAEGSKDQGGTGAIEPEEDSPNMIVYRKTPIPSSVSVSRLPSNVLIISQSLQ
ncbi:hypothetical protein XENORESO_020626, partial [Xenotaenia resolanae]